MDAVKFIKEKKRMCNSNWCSEECPVSMKNSGEKCCCLDLLYDYTEKYVDIVEKWSKENPERTRMSVFLKICPNAPRLSETALNICPKRIDSDFDKCGDCMKCKEDYWSEEVDDE